MDHRQVLGLDPLEVEREEVGAEAVGDRVLEAGRGAVLVGAEDPAAALLADVPARVGVAQDRVLGVGLAERDERRVGLGDDILVLDRDRRDADAEQPGGALGVVAGGGDDVLGADLEGLVGGDEVAALLGHHAAADDPLGAGPVVAVDLGLADDLDAALAGALGHRLGDVGGVDVAVGRVEERADEVLGADERPALADLLRGQPLEGDADGLGGRGVELELVHPRPGLRHAQVADDREAGVEAGLGLERLVELHRVVVDVAGRVAHVEERQQAGGVPGRAGGQLVALEEHGVGPAGLRQMVGDRGADRAAADHHRPRMASHRRPPSDADGQCLAEAAPAQAGRADARRADCDAGTRGRDARFRHAACRFRRRPISRRPKERRHEDARIAGGRGTRPRRLCRRAGGAADDFGSAGPDRPRRGRQPRGGGLLAGAERRPRDRHRQPVRRPASTPPATSSPSTSTRSR